MHSGGYECFNWTASYISDSDYGVGLVCRDLVGAFLPADQGHTLMRAAGAVMELHSECSRNSKKAAEERRAEGVSDGDGGGDSGVGGVCDSEKEKETEREQQSGEDVESAAGGSGGGVGGAHRRRSLSNLSDVAVLGDMLNKAILADPAGTIFSAAENVLTEKRNFDDGLTSLEDTPKDLEGESSSQQTSVVGRNMDEIDMPMVLEGVWLPSCK